MLHQCNIWCVKGISDKPSDSAGSWTFYFRLFFLKKNNLAESVTFYRILGFAGLENLL